MNFWTNQSIRLQVPHLGRGTACLKPCKKWKLGKIPATNLSQETHQITHDHAFGGLESFGWDLMLDEPLCILRTCVGPTFGGAHFKRSLGSSSSITAFDSSNSRSQTMVSTCFVMAIKGFKNTSASPQTGPGMIQSIAQLRSATWRATASTLCCTFAQSNYCQRSLR